MPSQAKPSLGLTSFAMTSQAFFAQWQAMVFLFSREACSVYEPAQPQLSRVLSFLLG